MKFFRTYILPAIIIGSLSTLLTWGMFSLGWFESLELKTLDLRFVLRGEREMPREEARDLVKVVAIDAHTIDKVGRWPWPRGVIARLISGVCGEAEFEDPFADEGWEDVDDGGWEDIPADDEGWEDIPDDEGWEDIPAEDEGWEDIPDDEGWEDIPAEESDEEVIPEEDEGVTPETEVVEEQPQKKPLGAQRVLGIDILMDRSERDYSEFLLHDGEMMSPQEQDDMAVQALSACDSVVHVGLIKGQSETGDTGTGDRTLEKKMNGSPVYFIQPIEAYMDANPKSRIGLANMQKSRFDQRVRKMRLYFKFDGEDEYNFPLSIMSLANFLGVEKEDIVVKEGEKVVIGDIEIPVDKNGDIYINYRGKEYERDENGILNKDNVFIGMEILENPDQIPLLLPGNYIFLIGVTDFEIRDVFPTPFAQAQEQYPNNAIMSGVEVHKEAIDTILQGQYLHDAPVWKMIIFIFIGCVLVTASTMYKKRVGVIVAAAFAGGYLYFTLGAFTGQGTIYPVFTVLQALPICFLAAIFYRNLVVDKEKNAVKNIFKSYVAPHVLNELMDNPDDLKLGGKKSKVSVLFSDIRGFTSISEKLEPDVLIQGLNHYLGQMADIVIETHGYTDKFIGDAVMAIWGAPLPGENDTRRAVGAAMQMRDTLDRIRPEVLELWGNIEGIDIKIGIGVNTGEATLGNIGSASKLDYTVIGDTVNLASRLEGLTKQYGAFCIVSVDTYNEVKDEFDCRILDRVKVKGKVLPVAIYEVMGAKGTVSDKVKEKAARFTEGFEKYLEKNWDAAEVSFKKCLEIDSDYLSATMYLERCELYRQTPPPEDWDGSFAWKTK